MAAPSVGGGSSISALAGLLEILDRSVQPFGVDLLHHRFLDFVRALYTGPLRRPCPFGSRLVSLIHVPALHSDYGNAGAAVIFPHEVNAFLLIQLRPLFRVGASRDHNASSPRCEPKQSWEGGRAASIPPPEAAAGDEVIQQAQRAGPALRRWFGAGAQDRDPASGGTTAKQLTRTRRRCRRPSDQARGNRARARPRCAPAASASQFARR